MNKIVTIIVLAILILTGCAAASGQTQPKSTENKKIESVAAKGEKAAAAKVDLSEQYTRLYQLFNAILQENIALKDANIKLQEENIALRKPALGKEVDTANEMLQQFAPESKEKKK